MDNTWWPSKTVTELKVELRARGLASSGNKSELADRLTRDDEVKKREYEKLHGLRTIYIKIDTFGHCEVLGLIDAIEVSDGDTIEYLKDTVKQKLCTRNGVILLFNGAELTNESLATIETGSTVIVRYAGY